MSNKNEVDKFLKKFNASAASWRDFSRFLENNYENLEEFFEITQKVKAENFRNILKIYTPGTRFPAISITGNECELHCEHCNGKYLNGMRSIRDPESLEGYLLHLHKEGGVGALISGGCLSDGSVPLFDFLETIKNIKKTTNLIINTHTGLLNEKTAKKLVDANVDIVSFDITLDPEVIRNIYHLNKQVDDYKKAIKLLNTYNLNIVPHICIGLHYGKLNRELEALRYIKESGMNPSLIVFIALIPPPNKRNEFHTPYPNDIAKIIGITRVLFPQTELSLGCMRPRRKYKEEIEIKSYRSGINRIVMPSKKTLKQIRTLHPKIEFEHYSACCAIPPKYEKLIRNNQLGKKLYTNL